MPLAGVLSAMREIILDLEKIPESREERTRLYQTKFPTLTKEEIEDLAKIPAERFSVYNSTIFSGECSTLQNHFPLCFALLNHYWTTVYDKPFDALRLAKELHKARPWKSNSTFGLAENFKNYLAQELSVLSKKFPVINAAARFEYLILLVKRDPDNSLMSERVLPVSALGAFTVDALLELQFEVVPAVRFEEFNYDLLELKRKLAEDSSDLSKASTLQHTFAALSRNRENITRWRILPEGVWKFLKGFARDANNAQNVAGESLGRLAEVFVESQKHRELGEEALFGEFLELSLSLVDAGLIILIDPEAK